MCQQVRPCAFPEQAPRPQIAARPALHGKGIGPRLLAHSVRFAGPREASASLPQNRHRYQGQSFKSHRHRWCLVLRPIEDSESLVRQADFAAQRRERVAHANTRLRFERARQNLANLGLRAAPMLCGSHPQRPVDIIRQITYRQHSPDITSPSLRSMWSSHHIAVARAGNKAFLPSEAVTRKGSFCP